MDNLIILNGSNYLRSDGGQATYIKNMHSDLSKYFNLKYIYLPEYCFKVKIIPLRVLYMFQVILYLVPKTRKDLVLSHTPEASFIACLFNYKVIHIFHGNNNPLVKSKFVYGKYFKIIFTYFEKYIIKNAKILYTVGENYKNAIPIYTPISKTLPLVSIEDRKDFIFMGRLEEVKNVDQIIKLYAKLDQNIQNNNKLLIVGEGTQKDKLKKLVDLLNLNNNVIFFEHLSNDKAIDILRKCKISLMASSFEGFPMFIAESLSYGIPVISTNIGSISNVVVNNFNGKLLNTFNYEEYEHSITEILTNYQTYSSNAIKSSSVFCPKQIVNQIKNDINKVK